MCILSNIQLLTVAHVIASKFFVRSMHQSNETLNRQWIQFILKAQQLWQPTASKLITLWFFSSRFRHPQKIESMAGKSRQLPLPPFVKGWRVMKSWRTCFNFAQSNPIRCRCWVSCWEGFSCILCATSCTPKRIKHDQTNRIQQKTGRTTMQTSDMLCKI